VRAEGETNQPGCAALAWDIAHAMYKDYRGYNPNIRDALTGEPICRSPLWKSVRHLVKDLLRHQSFLDTLDRSLAKP
jgi:hypothetical protein